MPKHRWTSAEVVDCLREAYTPDDLAMPDEWALLVEVPLRVPGRYGPDDLTHWGANERRIDVLLVRGWASGIGHLRVAIEVKVSRSDYRNETDAKRAPAWAAAHRCLYAAPAGVIDPATLPAGWGLLETYETPVAASEAKAAGVGGWRVGPRCIQRTRAEQHESDCDLDYLVSAVARIAGRLRERLHRGTDDASQNVALRAQVARLEGQLDRALSNIHTERQRTADARRALAAVDGATECADCGHRLRWDSRDRRGSRFKHADPDIEQTCADARSETLRAEREAFTGTAYIGRMYDAPPPEPAAIRAARQADIDADKARSTT